MSFKNPFPLSVFLLLFLVHVAHAQAHPNPLDILNGGNRHKVTLVATPKKQKQGHHFSPLDAMKGRYVIKDNGALDTKAVSPSPKVIHLDVKPSGNQKKVKTRPKVSPHIRVTQAPKKVNSHTQNTPPSVEGMVLPQPAEDAAPSLTADNSEIPTGQRLEKLLVETEKLTPSAMEKAYHAAKEKTLYLTFDDGPINGTANVLRVLKEENVKATMFCIGREVVNNPQLFQREISMPNLLVANHTHTHANGHYRRFYNSSTARVVADIDKAQRVIGGAKYLRLCGRNVWRLPTVKRDDWGISVAQQGREIPKYNALWNHGYFTYGWDVEWLFSHKTQRPLFNGEEMARRVNLHYQGAHTAKRGKVVLLAHDFMFRSAYNTQQLRTFIQIMKAQGWRFETIDDYSRETPDAYAHTEKKTPANKLRPAQKVARQAEILLPENKPEIVKGSGTVVSLSTRLGRAIRSQSFIEIRRLLAHGADINGRTPEGKIPLNIAVETNNAVLVRMLVERGARIFNLDAHGMSPMGIAQKQNSTVIIRYLQQQIAQQKQRRLKQTLFSSSESFVDR